MASETATSSSSSSKDWTFPETDSDVIFDTESTDNWTRKIPRKALFQGMGPVIKLNKGGVICQPGFMGTDGKVKRIVVNTPDLRSPFGISFMEDIDEKTKEKKGTGKYSVAFDVTGEGMLQKNFREWIQDFDSAICEWELVNKRFFDDGEDRTIKELLRNMFQSVRGTEKYKELLNLKTSVPMVKRSVKDARGDHVDEMVFDIDFFLRMSETEVVRTSDLAAFEGRIESLVGIIVPVKIWRTQKWGVTWNVIQLIAHKKTRGDGQCLVRGVTTSKKRDIPESGNDGDVESEGISRSKMGRTAAGDDGSSGDSPTLVPAQYAAEIASATADYVEYQNIEVE